jgi:hypothetical protein
MIVKCDVVDCIYNEHCKCEAGTIDIALNVNSGIGHIECVTYVHNVDFRKER